MTETKLAKFKRLFPWADPRYVNFPWADPEEYDVIPLSSEVADVKAELMAEYVTPYNLPWLSGYVLKELVEADREPDIGIKHERLQSARTKARNAHLAALANGRIKNKDEIVEPMAEDVKEKLRELNEQRRLEKAAKRAMVEKADNTSDVPIKKSKKPMFDDPETQKALMAKYPWATNSFRQDPNKSNSTIVDIKCGICGNLRQIHLADLFHTKYCVACKKLKKVRNK